MSKERWRLWRGNRMLSDTDDGATVDRVNGRGGQMAQEHSSLRLGDVAPPFALRTDEGREVRLADVVSSGPAVVVFIRGTW
jgi:hypothetical protein